MPEKELTLKQLRRKESNKRHREKLKQRETVKEAVEIPKVDTPPVLPEPTPIPEEESDSDTIEEATIVDSATGKTFTLTSKELEAYINSRVQKETKQHIPSNPSIPSVQPNETSDDFFFGIMKNTAASLIQKGLMLAIPAAISVGASRVGIMSRSTSTFSRPNTAPTSTQPNPIPVAASMPYVVQQGNLF
jgi:hypothetical protein